MHPLELGRKPKISQHPLLAGPGQLPSMGGSPDPDQPWERGLVLLSPCPPLADQGSCVAQLLTASVTRSKEP